MEDKREVSLDRVEAFKREKGIHFHFETSAKTGENIESLFIRLFKSTFFTETVTKLLLHSSINLKKQ